MNILLPRSSILFQLKGLPKMDINNPPGLSLRNINRSAAFGSQVKGMIASKAPSKIMCQEGKTYSWCACGLSNKQPFCDGSHKNSTLGLTPIKWTSTATKDFFFCNCKQTNSRPFCDGSHKKL